MRKAVPRSNAGFTIIELLIATSVFSVLLLVMTMGILEVGRLFFKGITYTNTQETARTIMDDISQAIQFSGDPVVNPITPTGTVNGFCVGSRRYSYTTGVRITGTNHALVADRFDTTCNSLTPAQNFGALDVDSKELLARNMRIANLRVECAVAGPPDCPAMVYNITVRVVFAGDDLVCSPTAGDCNNPAPSGNQAATDLTCKILGRNDSQFCSVSELTTTVKRRVQ